jgi:hypothetical protein
MRSRSSSKMQITHSVVNSLMTLDRKKHKQEKKQSKPIILIMLLTSKGMADEAKFPYINI